MKMIIKTKFIFLFVVLLKIDKISTIENATDRSETMIITNLHPFNISSKTLANFTPKCLLIPNDVFLEKDISDLVDSKRAVLIRYHLYFNNYTTSPLKKYSHYLKPELWTRVINEHGQILINLAFNYGILSMKTLTLGNYEKNVLLNEGVNGCMDSASVDEQFGSLIYLLIRDFKIDGKPSIKPGERICHEEVMPGALNYGVIVNRCITMDRRTELLQYEELYNNFWIDMMYTMLIIIRFILLFFGPLFIMSTVKSFIKIRAPYIIKLKSSLVKKIVVTKISDIKTRVENIATNYNAKFIIDLRLTSGFPKFRDIVTKPNFLYDKMHTVKFNEYNILVNYGRTQSENKVSVGFFKSIYGVLFKCSIKNSGPFADCCQTLVIDTSLSSGKQITWIKFWRSISYFLLVLFVPFPYYVRLVLYYYFESEEISIRKKKMKELNYAEMYNTSFLQYFTPLHPFFIFLYIIYFLLCLIIVFMPHHTRRGHPLRRITASFRDLDNYSFIKLIELAFENILWPFKKFGIFGFIIALVYWIFAIPLTLFMCFFYSIPSFYIIFRLIHHCKEDMLIKIRKPLKSSSLYQVKEMLSQKKTMERFKLGNKLETCISKKVFLPNDDVIDVDADQADHNLELIKPKLKFSESTIVTSKFIRMQDYGTCLFYIVTTIMSIITFFAFTLLIAEIGGCIIEIIVFTIMGIIVNAGTLLRYLILVIIVVLYCFDSFNNVEKRYLKLNKTIFAELTKRIRDIEKVTGQPCSLQQNSGFKSQELNEQAEYEISDDLISKPRNHWLINDLVLFIDSLDTPRIPIKLFEQICNIEVYGVPGPIYRGHLDALKELAKVLFFVWLVFITIMTFSEVYSVSSTNQTIATMAGALVPLILRSCVFAQVSDVEVGTVTFRSRMDEVIRNYKQCWPMFDLPFDVVSSEKQIGMEGDGECISSSVFDLQKGVEDVKQDIDYLIFIGDTFKDEIYV